MASQIINAWLDLQQIHASLRTGLSYHKITITQQQEEKIVADTFRKWDGKPRSHANLEGMIDDLARGIQEILDQRELERSGALPIMGEKFWPIEDEL